MNDQTGFRHATRVVRRGTGLGVLTLGAAVVFGAQTTTVDSAATGTKNAMRAGSATVPPRFVDPSRLDFTALLPPPPAEGSLAALADLETVLQVQAARTREQEEWAKLVERDSVFNHATILGDWFTPENLPVATAFFQDLGHDLRAIDAVVKKPFLRPRPSKADTRVQPCVSVGASTGYPSGSAIQAFVWAELLADVFPEKRSELVARAHRAAWGRLVGGVHYPTDLVAGRMLATPFLAECRKSGAFNERFERCRREMQAAARRGANGATN